MPQIANQDYNFIDFTQLPIYEAVELLYRAYLQGTVFDCVVIKPAENGKDTFKVLDIKEVSVEEANIKGVWFMGFRDENGYFEKSPLTTDDSGFLIFKDTPIFIVSDDGFKLKPTVKDEVLTGVEVTTEKVENNVNAQYFKEWMIGQPIVK